MDKDGLAPAKIRLQFSPVPPIGLAYREMKTESRTMTANLPPDEDIRQSLEAASQGPALKTGNAASDLPEEAFSDTLTQSGGAGHAWLVTRYTLAKCAMMAEKYPWQTLVLLIVTVGCGSICSYFGWAVLGSLVLYAANAEE